MTDTTPLACPTCGQIDHVQKLTALVNSATHQLTGTTVSTDHYQDKDGRWHTSSGSVPFSGTQQSMLAKELAMLPQPHAKFHWNCLAVIFFLLAFGTLYGVVGGLGLSFSTRGVEKYYAYALTIGSFLLLILMTYLMARFWRANVRKQRKANADQVINLEKWRLMVQKWEQLYYCSRDDCVYDPQEKRAIKPQELQSYLEQNSPAPS